MSQRIENIIDGVISGKTSAAIEVPSGYSQVQVVIDRTRFEDMTTKDETLFEVGIYSGDNYLGGAGFAGGRFGPNDADSARPGMRMLWATYRTQLPSDVTELSVTIGAKKEFDCLSHVDFL